jgi:hypothetical protein
VIVSPRVDGMLFPFVNDAALAGPWNPFHENTDEDDRSRVARVAVEPVNPAAATAPQRGARPPQ